MSILERRLSGRGEAKCCRYTVDRIQGEKSQCDMNVYTQFIVAITITQTHNTNKAQ